MRPRPSVVSLALVVIALAHAWWGFRVLARGDLIVAMSQLVAAGGLLLAGVAVASRLTFSTGLWIAAGATAIRLLNGLAQPGPWVGPTAALVAGLALAAWAARRLEAPGLAVGATPLALRGGFLLLAAGYAGFLGMSIAFGNPPNVWGDLAVRAVAAVAVAVWIEAPAAQMELKRRRSTLPEA